MTTARKTTVTRFKVYSNDISNEKTFELPGSFSARFGS